MSHDDTSLSKSILGCFGLVFYMIILVVVASICGGLSTTILWEWFAVPIFGAPEITVVQAIGLHLLVSSIVTEPYIKNRAEKKDNIWETLLEAFLLALAQLLSLPFGWVVLQFM